MMRKLQDLQKCLGYSFKKEDYLTSALRHRSMGAPNNERLEFLGDSLLNYLVAEKLYHQFPKGTEGELTRLRANLVNKQSLAEIAFRLQLDKVIELGIGEKKSGGFRRESILADAVEAIFAAIYLDSNMESLQNVIEKLYSERFEHLSLKKLNKDSKTKLQEWLQAKKKPLPVYTIVSSEHDGQDAIFVVQCEVEGLEPLTARGKNRRLAEQKAAAVALEKLHVK